MAYLNKTRSASVREISRALQMPSANIRHHLRILVSDGRLEVVPVKTPEKRGRPQQVYSLPRAVLGDNLPALSDALLTEGVSMIPVAAVASHLAGDSDFRSQLLAKRLHSITEKLNQMNYHARWEAGSNGPRIIFSHCPYAAIIDKHPELCRMDKILLEKLMGQPAEQLTKIGRDGSSSCVFIMMERL